jgi:predicted PurR-regulated permease PerM
MHNWRRVIFLAVSASIAAFLVIAARDVMLPFVLSLLIAYVLTPLVTAVEGRRVPRPLAIIFVYVMVLGSLAVFIRGAAPRIGTEFRRLRSELPELADQVKRDWLPSVSDRLRSMGIEPAASARRIGSPSAEMLPNAFVIRPQPDGSFGVDVGKGVIVTQTKGGWRVEGTDDEDGPFDPNRVIADALGKTFAYARNNSLEVALAVRDVISGISRVIFVFFITLMLAAYTILTRERIVSFFRSLFDPTCRSGFDRLIARIDDGLSGVVRGQLIICGINGVLSAIGFAMVGLRYWPVMALVAAICSLVPIFGSIASAVPAVAVGLTQGMGTSAFVLAWIVGIHQLEANVLNPKILGDAAKIHPVLVIFALLVGEHFFHAIGALLAVPVLSIAQSIFLHVRAAIDDPKTQTTDV